MLVFYALEGLAGFIGVVFLCFLLYLHHLHQKYAHIPSPPRDSFIFGNLPYIKKQLDKGDFLTNVLHNWMLDYGHTICVFFLHQVFVVTVDPEAVKELLVNGSHPKDYFAYESVGYIYGKYRFAGKGLVTELDHEKWAPRRMVFNPVFHHRSLKQLMNEFNQTADDLMRKLQGLADSKTPVSLLDEMNRVALDIIGKVAFGKNLNTLHDDTSPFPSALRTSAEGFMHDIAHPLHKYLPVKMKLKSQVADAVKLLRETGKKWMEERIQAIEKGEYTVEDILSYIIKAYDVSDPESMDKCLDDVVSFFFAGHDTTANTMSFLLQEIGKNPEIFSKLQKEVDQVVGQKAMIEYDDLSKLEYLGLLLKETLRLYPPVPVTFRNTISDIKIQNFHIPKGSILLVPIYGLARTPEFHADPYEFKPERFKKDSAERPNMYNNIPFSLGPRSCIGQVFATIEAKVIIAKFMQYFELTLDPNQSFDIVQEITLKPKGKTMATLTLRNI